MAIKSLSTAGKMQGEISRQVGCSQCVVSSTFHLETEDHKFGGSPTKLTSSAAQNPALNFHKAPPWSGDIMGRNVNSCSWTSVFSANKCHCCCLSRSLVAFSASDD